ncbi:hypothetical protein HUJ04_001420 [Dendroctonus ponderosae]|nr:hypothetical protein HUJ04_001420 [Dendroctonus ponderosae]
MAYRSSVHEATGCSPAKVLFGREIRLGDLMFGTPGEEQPNTQDYIEGRKKRLNDVHEQVRNKLRISSDRAKTRYDLLANSKGFQEAHSGNAASSVFGTPSSILRERTAIVDWAMEIPKNGESSQVVESPYALI